MSLPRETMLEIMAYADGELDEKEHLRIQALLVTSDEARRLFESLGTLSGVVGQIYKEPEPAAFEGIADAVMGKIAEESLVPQRASIRPPKVVSLSDAREKRIKMGAAIAAVVALAAGIALTTRFANETPFAQHVSPTSTRAPSPAPMPTVTPAVPQAVAVAPTGSAGVDVEQVDSTHAVEVFYLPTLAGNASSVFVWIDDKPQAP